MTVEKNYIVKCVEEVLDAFDEFERDNPMKPINVSAKSLEEAISLGRTLSQSEIDVYRREGGYLSSGTFTANVVEVTDKEGNVLYTQNRDRT